MINKKKKNLFFVIKNLLLIFNLKNKLKIQKFKKEKLKKKKKKYGRKKT